eukprot:COSAG01_NODE_6881_length_3454_cov_10.233979_3_plen_154_part_00
MRTLISAENRRTVFLCTASSSNAVAAGRTVQYARIIEVSRYYRLNENVKACTAGRASYTTVLVQLYEYTNVPGTLLYARIIEVPGSTVPDRCGPTIMIERGLERRVSLELVGSRPTSEEVASGCLGLGDSIGPGVVHEASVQVVPVVRCLHVQ